MSPVTPPIFSVANEANFHVTISATKLAAAAQRKNFSSKKINGSKSKIVSAAAKIIVRRVVNFANALPVPSALA